MSSWNSSPSWRRNSLLVPDVLFVWACTFAPEASMKKRIVWPRRLLAHLRRLKREAQKKLPGFFSHGPKE